MKSLSELRLGSDWSSFSKFRRKSISGILTRLPQLDKKLGGIKGLVVIQGEPGACKSTFCLQISLEALREGHPVFMLDCENGANRLRMRLVSQINRIAQHQVMSGSEEEEENWRAQIETLPLYVENSLKVSDSDEAKQVIVGYLKELYQQYQKPVLLVADSLQALPKLQEDPRLNIEEWIKFFDSIKVAADGIVYIIATSEKRRGTYNEAFKDGGKGSGTIEYKAESVLDLRKDGETNGVILQCTKNRDGDDNWMLKLDKAESAKGGFCFLLEERESFE
jgi:replicative DNA helicase